MVESAAHSLQREIIRLRTRVDSAEADAHSLREQIRALAEQWEASASQPVPDSPMRDWQARHAAQLRTLLGEEA